MVNTLDTSGLLKLLDDSRDQLVCDELNDMCGLFTKAAVIAALDHLYDRTVLQTLSCIDVLGFVTAVESPKVKLAGVLHRHLTDDWITHINTPEVLDD